MDSKLKKVFNKIDWFYFLLLIVISGSLFFYRYRLQVVQGPGWDTFAFLANALEFAGKSIGYAEPHRSPFLSFLVSLVFRLGWESEAAIFAVDCFLAFAGVLGFYLLLRLRFTPLFSFLGSLLFISYPAVFKQAGTGYTDLASVSFSIWSIYFFALGTQKSTKFLPLALLLFVAAALTRFTALLLIFPVLLIFFLKPFDKVRFSINSFLLGFFASFVLYMPFAIFYFKKFGNPFFPLAIAFSAASDTTSPAESFAYEPNLGWYIFNLKRFIASSAGETIFLVFALFSLVGWAFYFYRLLESTDFKKIGLAFLFALAYVLIFFQGGLILRQLAAFMLCFFLYMIFRSDDRKISESLGFFLLFFCWFLVYFDFHSHLGVKVDRYFIVMVPGFTYLALHGLYELTEIFSSEKIKTVLKGAVYFLISFFIAVSFFSYFQQKKAQPDYLVADAKKTSNWLKKQNISQAVIYSDLWPAFGWYLKRNVLAMPTFKDSRAFNHELEKNKADYFLTIRKRSLPSFKLVKKFGSVSVYKAKTLRSASKNRLLYLGRNWQNYLEEVLDYNYFVHFEVGRYGLGKTTYVDNFTIDELKKFPLIFLYNFRWKSREKAQDLLFQYLKGGGRVLIDLSANLGGLNYNLDGQSFLGVVAERKALSASPKITINPEVGVKRVKFSPFVSEGGGEWYGANYLALPGETSLKKLVEADGKILVAVQKIGKGKIYWIGYNLVWHAFIKENEEERKLIQRLVETALEGKS